MTLLKTGLLFRVWVDDSRKKKIKTKQNKNHSIGTKPFSYYHHDGARFPLNTDTHFDLVDGDVIELYRDAIFLKLRLVDPATAAGPNWSGSQAASSSAAAAPAAPSKAEENREDSQISSPAKARKGKRSRIESTEDKKGGNDDKNEGNDVEDKNEGGGQDSRSTSKRKNNNNNNNNNNSKKSGSSAEKIDEKAYDLKINPELAPFYADFRNLLHNISRLGLRNLLDEITHSVLTDSDGNVAGNASLNKSLFLKLARDELAAEKERKEPEEESESDNMYVVEEILDRRIQNGAIQYLIKWKGFGPGDNTWENITNIFAIEKIHDFEQKAKQGKITKRKKR